MMTSEFDFLLPEELIAQHPTPDREQSRLLFIERDSKKLSHHTFRNMPDFFGPNDVLVLNESKVLPARIVLPNNREIFLSERQERSGESEIWSCLVKPGKKFTVGTAVPFDHGETAEVLAITEDGLRTIKFTVPSGFKTFLDRYGQLPLPPYIRRPPTAVDAQRYQTVYAQNEGSVAAPTAGLHFTDDTIARLVNNGVTIERVTLHVGIGTFLPVKVDDVKDHSMHGEQYEITPETADRINRAKAAGKKITAIGSTALRALESSSDGRGNIAKLSGKTVLFLYPPASFKVVDHFLTNFHLPKSTLVMLTSAFASPGKTDGVKLLMKAYDEAIGEGYRFFSFGDASLFW